MVTTRLGVSAALVFVRENTTGAAPADAAVTAYGPPEVALAVAATEAAQSLVDEEPLAEIRELPRTGSSRGARRR